jgi:hypothetical protein
MATPQKQLINHVRVGTNRNIESVLIGGQEIIGPWGIETADSWAFFTQEWGGYRHEILERHGEQGDGFSRAEFLVKMREGKWRLKIDERWNSNTITRSHELTCVEDSWFMDFVSRYVFRSDVFPRAEIAGEQLPHRDHYKNYQHSVKQARLFGAGLDATVSLLDASAPAKFKQLMYVRGAHETWVVHVRLFPAMFDRKIIKKVRNVRMATPIPRFIASVLLAIPSIRNRIWYAGDKGDWSLAYHGLGLVRLPKGSTIRLASKVSFQRHGMAQD